MPESAPSPDETLRPALEALADRDADFAAAFAACGLPPERLHPPGFASLLHIIMGQQVSAHAARAIVARLEAAARPLTPERFLALDEPALRGVGLSRQKIRYGRILAEEVLSGALDLDALDGMADAEAIAALVRVKGVGRWTAEVYLLFALARPDVWPADDLAVQVGAQRLKRLPERPTRKQMEALAEPWRPHRSAAARFLWHLYRHPGVAFAEG